MVTVNSQALTIKVQIRLGICKEFPIIATINCLNLQQKEISLFSSKA